MPATITNLRTLQGVGIWADRNARSPDLAFRRYNLIYGFNGSGKSTLSRLFASLANGEVNPRLPGGCKYEVVMDDGNSFSCPARLSGLERRVMVFNADYIEENLQWATGRANPVFFIGSDQAAAAAKLGDIEAKITNQKTKFGTAQGELQVAERYFAQYKRERAKITAAHLYLGNRKYEAPNLARDYETWTPNETRLLSETDLDAAKQLRQKDEPMPKLTLLDFNAESVSRTFEFVSDLCTQSLTTVALEEVKSFPRMLMWLKEGHEFHLVNVLETCLLCGNPITRDRMTLLASALDDKIDSFVAKLSNTAARLQEVISSLTDLEETAPTWDAVEAALRPALRAARGALVETSRLARNYLGDLMSVLAEKQKQPASAADISRLPGKIEVDTTVESMTRALSSVNDVLAQHNLRVDDFAAQKQAAEYEIRKHFIAECRDDYAAHVTAVKEAGERLDGLNGSLRGLMSEAESLRKQVRAHGPAAASINSLIAAYLGHHELSIHPAEQGYEMHRHGTTLLVSPSEGEKTAIALAYFLSSIEAEGRTLKNSIVVIDDPVSSLDTKALNFACALVRNRLMGAGQLFILTHNLHCMNEFKKSWRGRARRAEENGGKAPSAGFYFIDVKMPNGESRRSASLVEMSKLLREYDSEYHYLFSQVLDFVQDRGESDDYGYMMPNVLRRILDVFLAFRCPGTSGLSGQIDKLCAGHPALDKNRLVALERLAHVESHSDSLDDLLTFSTMTLEETKAAAKALLDMIETVDRAHMRALKRLCA